MKKKFKGFTLIEIVVVVAIIGIIATILIPRLMEYVKKSQQTTANENARIIFQTLTSSAYDLDQQGIIMGNNGNFQLSDAGVTGNEGNCVNLTQWLSGNGFSNSQRSEMQLEVGGYIDIIYENGYPAYVAWSKKKTPDAIIGRYPELLTLNSGVTWDNWNDDL